MPRPKTILKLPKIKSYKQQNHLFTPTSHKMIVIKSSADTKVQLNDFQSINGGSLAPVAVIPQEVPHHIKGSLRVIRGHHLSCLVHQHEPEVAPSLRPPADLVVDAPDLLPRPLPPRDALPPQGVQVVEHPRCVHHVVLLSVVDQHPYLPQHGH
jgi:hypothetical protein